MSWSSCRRVQYKQWPGRWGSTSRPRGSSNCLEGAEGGGGGEAGREGAEGGRRRRRWREERDKMKGREERG